MLEVSFDSLMFQEYRAVLGESAEKFKYEFPIRYDFLDTVEGGNLSIQVHPRPDFIRENFGETFTQDECYYILDCVPGAKVNLGFQQGIVAQEFKQALQKSAEQVTPVDIGKYVQSMTVKKHDFFLSRMGQSMVQERGRWCWKFPQRLIFSHSKCTTGCGWTWMESHALSISSAPLQTSILTGRECEFKMNSSQSPKYF